MVLVIDPLSEAQSTDVIPLEVVRCYCLSSTSFLMPPTAVCSLLIIKALGQWIAVYNDATAPVLSIFD